MKIDPWSSHQYSDYARLRDEFGIEEFNLMESELPEAQRLFRRGVIFGHRDFGLIAEAVARKEPFCVLTGLVPSGKMHLGHKMVIDEVMYFQRLGAEIFIAVADLEAWGARGISLEKARETAIEEYVLNYIALGLEPVNCQVYFQSLRTEVKDMALMLSRRVNLSEMRSIYGFEDSTNMAHVISPLVQVGDILHVQLEKFGGPKPTIVPVGVDQDPHMRLTRGIAAAFRFYNVTIDRDGRTGIFVKGDGLEAHEVQRRLDKAEAALRGLGYSDFKKVPRYRALYLNFASAVDTRVIDRALSPIEVELGGYGFYPPSSTYHRFITGLTGDKMSSSKPETAIFLTDSPEEAKKKIRACKTGGRVSAEEQRKLGGDPERCSNYELLLYHLLEDDDELKEVYRRCRSGELLCGECKNFSCRKIGPFLMELAERRGAARDRLDEFVVDH